MVAYTGGLGKYGEIKADESEKCMVHRIMDKCLVKSGTCPRTPENYAIVYDFIESDEGWIIWDTYYELFHQKHPSFVGPVDYRQWTEFGEHAIIMFNKWKNRIKKEQRK